MKKRKRWEEIELMHHSLLVLNGSAQTFKRSPSSFLGCRSRRQRTALREETFFGKKSLKQSGMGNGMDTQINKQANTLSTHLDTPTFQQVKTMMASRERIERQYSFVSATFPLHVCIPVQFNNSLFLSLTHLTLGALSHPQLKSFQY